MVYTSKSTHNRELGATFFALLCACSEPAPTGSRPPGAGPSAVATDPTLNLAGGEDPNPTQATPLGAIDTHALIGVTPNRGPYSGGQRALIRGRGFDSSVRVWVGETEVPTDQVVATQSDLLQLALPPGSPGSVDVVVQNGEDSTTRRRLVNAYTYEAFVVTPSEGPTSGGTVLTLTSGLNTWGPNATVTIDRNECTVLSSQVLESGSRQIECQLPSGTNGLKTVEVISGGRSDSVLGALRYVPGTAPRGGLFGEPLLDELEVIAVAPNGAPIPNATVILGSELDLSSIDQPGSRIHTTDEQGLALFAGLGAADAGLPDALQASGFGVQVTVAARCFQPVTFTGVEVDTVRAELNPVASPACGSGGGQLSGGSSRPPVTIRGQLVWNGGVEFKRAAWVNVPTPRSPEQSLAAYIFEPSGNPESSFRLPRERLAITPESEGRIGYEFEWYTGAGNRSYYALAGIEDRSVSPPRFTAYAMGSVHGLYAEAGQTIEDVVISMDRTLDQLLELEVQDVATSERGPHSIRVNVAVQFPSGGYAVLPRSTIEVPLPLAGPVSFVGLPALVGSLSGGRYVARGRALSRAGQGPASVLPYVRGRDTNEALAVGEFLPVPELQVGTDNGWSWNHQLGFTLAPPAATPATEGSDAGAAEDPFAPALVRYSITSGAGLITWTIATPPDQESIELPDLTRLAEGGLIEGAVDVSVSLARINNFAPERLRTSQLLRGSWQSFSTDTATSRLEPSL